MSPNHGNTPKTRPSTSARWGASLPSESEVVRLVKRFFSDTAMLFPYIHEESFWEVYKAAKESNFKRIRHSWLGLLYMILAMAAGTAPETITPGSSDADPDSYFACAEALCFSQMMVNANLEISES